MKRIYKFIFIFMIIIFLNACNKKEYIYFNYNCNNKMDYHKCELKNSKINCDIKEPSCEDKEFIGWYRANEYENPVDLTSKFNTNEIIYARWNDGSGEEPSSQQIEEPSSEEEPSSDVEEPSTYIPDEPSSNEQPSSSNEQPSSSQTPTVTKYNLTFDGNGGSTVPSSKSVAYNATLPSINEKPVRSWYTFMGWYDNKDYTKGTKYYNESNTPVRKYDKKANIKLYAGWKKNTLSIRYNGNGGVWNNPTKNVYSVNQYGTVTLKKDGSIFQAKYNYDENIPTTGLLNYNGSYLNWKKDGYTVESKKEYIIQNGTATTVLDQDRSYTAVELAKYGGCDLSKKNCLITVKVNWQKNDYSKVNYNNFKWTFYKVNSGPIKKYTSESVYSYAVWAPKNVSDLNGVSLPVIIWLHGAGEMGDNRPTDGSTLLNSGLLKVISDWKKYNLDPVPAIIVAPQSPSNWGTKINYDTIKALLAYVEDVYHTNPSKRVLMGHSKGGRGTIHIAYKYQDLNLYAVVPLSGGMLRYDYDNKKLVILDDGKQFFSKLKIRGYGETTYPKEFFNWIGKPNEYNYYAEWDFPDYRFHGKVPERAMTTDLNNDGVSDLVYWLFGESARIHNR